LIAASLSAPVWGHASDRVPRARVVLAGLVGTILSIAPFAFWHTLPALYGYQIAAGISFGAIGPVALAMLYESAPVGAESRRIAWFGSATLLGYLVGPALASWIGSTAEEWPPHVALTLSLFAQAAIAFLALILLTAANRSSESPKRTPKASAGILTGGDLQPNKAIPILAAMLASFVVGGFEIAVSFFVQSPLHLSTREVTAVFMACSGAMIFAQMLILPRLPRNISRLSLSLWCLVLSGIFLVGFVFVESHWPLVILGAVQGLLLGLAFGLLSFDAAIKGGRDRGRLLGYQNAATNAGQALGAAAGAAGFLSMGAAAFPALGSVSIFIGACIAIDTKIKR